MRTRLLIFFFVGFNYSLVAQTPIADDPKRRILYYNSFLAGGLFGEQGKGSGVTLSTTHGIRVNRLALGAGVGLDSYFDWKTLPVFGSVSFDFGRMRSNRANALFLQLNVGYAEAWLVRDNESWMPEYRDYGGTMLSSLIGYRITKESFSLYMLAGHKFQRAHMYYGTEPWSSFSPQSSHFIEEDMNRVVVQIGFGLH
jgi:hypothetical protein